MKKLKKEDYINPDGTMTTKGTITFALATLFGVWCFMTGREITGKILSKKK